MGVGLRRAEPSCPFTAESFEKLELGGRGGRGDSHRKGPASWERETGAAERWARGRKPGCVRLQGKGEEGQE